MNSVALFLLLFPEMFFSPVEPLCLTFHFFKKLDKSTAFKLEFLSASLLHSRPIFLRASGEIGIHARFRFSCPKACGFESRLAHHFFEIERFVRKKGIFMQPVRGKVPHFSLRPHPAVSAAFFFVLIVGVLLGLSFLSQERGAGDYRQKANFVFLVTGVICFLLLILGTSKLWFPHLWRKNSTHDRHKQHSSRHPVYGKQNPNSSRRSSSRHQSSRHRSSR